MAGSWAGRPGFHGLWPSRAVTYSPPLRGLRWRIVAGLTGDIARRDPDDYCWFIGRADDVIESAA
ncbi:hypothetical protein Atai01_61870 [Amycolatopsis taiwanensis]|uniref:Uncharacterized protein n=1 Tax=Amycolatopsis taiwanensis TaxID=342230 RepID=A0A9W6R6E2_9PSEU|nr:hypothetical protein Atai01_61870 [Amycolatopsis taiwanensis]